MTRLLATFLATLIVAGCAPMAAREDAPDGGEARGAGHSPPPVAAPPPVEVPERFVTGDWADAVLDSLATWQTLDGEVRVFATAKGSHQIQVHSGEDGRLLQRFGGPGDAPGRFDRPNGIGIHGDLVFVTERDNHRVQVFELPTMEPLGTFGESELVAPYGIWMHEIAPGTLEVIITDSFMEGSRYDIVPPLDTLHRRLQRFHVQLGSEGLDVSHEGTFGETTQDGALRMTESVLGDPLHNRLLVADEYAPDGFRLRVYDLDGGYSGLDLGQGVYAGDPEGIALWACADGSGYWISVDQREPLTYFMVYDRESLALLGRFHGRTTSGTDGIALHAVGSRAFPDGVLYAVHDDRAIAAFAWTDIARALGLATECTYR